MNIGLVSVGNPFVLAPMACINCTAFRLLCKENGAGLLYTQMIDSDLMCCKSREEIGRYLNIFDEERPVTVQLVGSDVDRMVHAAQAVEEFADIIDINMGCILPEYMKRKCGASLLKDMGKMEEITIAVIGAVEKPVTAKIRIGWDSQTINAVNVSQILERCGIQAICIHGRTAEQKYSGKVNWTMMKQVKGAVSVPVIANGDVTSYRSGQKMLEKTGCDAVMIGREAKHAPWVFDKDFVVSNETVQKQIMRFIELYERYEKRKSLKELREHVFWMFRDFKTRKNPKELHKVCSVEEIKEFLGDE